MICNLGSRVVNNYLISSDLGYILIDTGYDGGFPRFLKMLGKNGVDPKEIKEVLGRDPAESARHALPRARQALQDLGAPEVPEQPRADQAVPAEITAREAPAISAEQTFQNASKRETEGG